jgi:hypothetical protein
MRILPTFSRIAKRFLTGVFVAFFIPKNSTYWQSLNRQYSTRWGGGVKMVEE